MKIFLVTSILFFSGIYLNAQCVWVGGTAGNTTTWGVATNWTGTGCGFGTSVPAIDDDVTIAPTVFDPIVSGTANAASVTVDPLADLTVVLGGYLTIDGQISVAALGGFYMANGDLAFEGVSNFIVNLGTWSVTGGKIHLSRSVDDTQVFNDNDVLSNVTIDGGRIVTMTTTITNVKDIVISGGSTLDIGTQTLTGSGGGKLKVKNNSRLMVSGVDNFPTGFATYELEEGSYVEYYLNGAQTLAAHDYWHLDLTGGGTKSITTSETVGVQGVLDIEDGATLATLGYGSGEAYLRLISTGEAANQTAKIGILSDESTGTITGAGVMCERYINLTTPDQVHWNDWCSPLTDLQLKSWYYTGWPMTGVGGVSGEDYPNNPFCSVLQYDATTIGTEFGSGNGILDKNDGWLKMSHINNVVTNGRGVRIYTGARSRVMKDLGTPRMGDVQVVLDYYDEPTAPQSQEGWNLIGNPYMSTIDFDLLSFNKVSDGSPAAGGVDSTADDYINAFWVYSNNYGYYTYNGITGIGNAPYYVNVGNFTGVSDASLISSHKAFWVKAYNTNVRIDFEETDKAIAGTQFVKNVGEVLPKIRVQVQQIENGFSSAAVLAFVPEASPNFDEYDTEYLQSNNGAAPNIYFLSTDEKSLTIQLRPFESVDIPMVVEVNKDGNTMFTFYDMDDIPTGACLWFEDVETQEKVALTGELSVTIALTKGVYQNRFVLHVQPILSANVLSNLSCFGSSDGEVQLHALSNEYTTFNWYKNEVFIGELQFMQDTVLHQLSAGNYRLEQATHAVCVSTSNEVVVVSPVEIIPSFTKSQSVVDLITQTGTVDFINHTTGAVHVVWHFSDTDTYFYDKDTVQHTFVSPGEHTIELLAYQDNMDCAQVFTDTIMVLGLNSSINDETDSNEWMVVYGQEELNIAYQLNQPGQGDVEISNMQGKLVSESTLFFHEHGIVQIPFTGAHGVYLVTTFIHNQKHTHKWVF